jgi:hypothetical protein
MCGGAKVTKSEGTWTLPKDNFEQRSGESHLISK